jgi:two-component system, cell cycle response regulator
MESPRLAPTPARPLVLLVDGQPDRLALNALALSTMGFDVLAAHDAAAAFGRASSKSPDVIVTDLLLCHDSGWDLLARLKSEPSTHHIPVVILDAIGRPATKERAEREGAALLVPPCLPDRLALELRSLLVRRRSGEPAPTVH